MTVVDFVMRRAYASASIVRNHIEAECGLEELDWTDDRVLGCLAKYSKSTLLHLYTCATISVHERYLFRNEIDDVEQVNAIIDDFSAYQIPVTSFQEADPYQWHLVNEDAFERKWEAVTEEVFQLLFSDRQLLLEFNQYVASFLRDGGITIPAQMLASNGFLKRDSYYPSWLRKGLLYRECGRCVFCQMDLTSQFNTDSQMHFDHMVPLVAWGINDPCNLQLLCESCNLSKSDSDSRTSVRYTPYWVVPD